MRREPVRPSERRSESAAGECVWAAAIFYWERLRVMAVGAELAVARSYGADVGGALAARSAYRSDMSARSEPRVSINFRSHCLLLVIPFIKS